MSKDKYTIESIISAIDKIKKYASDYENGEELYYDKKAFDSCMPELFMTIRKIIGNSYWLKYYHILTGKFIFKIVMNDFKAYPEVPEGNIRPER